ncbi:MAG: glycosyltransferase family 4 protein [Fimbriimonadaceae bacterium]|nr:glycosyltransferase family 4 protein [Fimbriimonadaceae bacterium]
MHVLLDARCVLSPKTGDRTYWLGLLGALPAAAPDWRFTAALDAAPPDGLLPAAPNLSVAVAPSPRGRLWSVLALPRLARELAVDLVHLQYVGPPWLPCPLVTTVHDCSFELFPQTFTRRDGAWLRTLVPRTARRAAAVVGVSETTRDDLVRLYGLPPDRVFAAPNGIGSQYQPAPAAAQAAVRAQYGLPETFLLSLGVLQPRKNLLGLINAYAEAVRRHGLTAPLAIAGKAGWLYREVYSLVEGLRLQDQVRFLGYVADADLPPLYSAATLFLYPSLYEGFGLPPLEALACGTPAVVSDTPALVEVTGDAAPHLPPHDAVAWADCLARLLADPDHRAALAAAGRARAATYTWARSAREHLAAYRFAVSGCRAAGRP